MRRLRKYLALSPAGRAVVLRSLILLPTVALLLRVRGMGRTHAWLARLGPFAAGDTSALASREVAVLVGAVASIVQARCLSRSLVLWQLLRDQSNRVEVRLGVSKNAEGGLCAHAWVDFDGLPLNDGPEVFERYSALPSLPRRFASNHPKTLPL
jgi:hypothetical protein